MKLSNAANGSVIADSIRLERVPDAVDAFPLPGISPEGGSTADWLAVGSKEATVLMTTPSTLSAAVSSSFQAELDLLETTTSLLAFAVSGCRPEWKMSCPMRPCIRCSRKSARNSSSGLQRRHSSWIFSTADTSDN